MRVAVVGGGVVGLAPAWYLKKMGAEPFVVEAGVAGVQDLIEGADMSRSTGAVRRGRMWSCRSFRGSPGVAGDGRVVRSRGDWPGQWSMAQFSAMSTESKPSDRMAARVKSLIRAVPDFPIPGIRFRDVMGLVENADGFREATVALADRFRGAAPEVVVGIEARGFIFGVPVAQELGVGFVPVRKAGKLPGEVRGVSYELEYGTARVEMQVVAPIGPGTRVLLIDDLVATGGSAAAAIELIRGMGGHVVGAGFVVDLPELPGAGRLRGLGVEVFALCSFLAEEE